jgi:dynein heavy chain, axonemal
LVSNAVIDWFFPWPGDALQKVAEFFLVDEPLSDEHRASVVQHLVYAHQQVTQAASQFALELRRHYYVTPKNYLDFIHNYKVQSAVNGKRITQSTRRLQGGLQKLIEAAEAVDRMQVSNAIQFYALYNLISPPASFLFCFALFCTILLS